MDAPHPRWNSLQETPWRKKSALKGKRNISDEQLTMYGYEILTVTGLFTSQCTRWRNLKAATQTWEEFQILFTQVVKDYMLNTTAADVKYSAAQVQEIIDAELATQLQLATKTNDANTNPT